MTEFLYYKDAYLKSFDAEVISCEEVTYNKNKAYAIILDSTCFFPEQGGQDSDLGVLATSDTQSRVLHVSISNNTITHICDKPIASGLTIRGSIDWDHRFDLMQQHSGEHLVSGTVHKLFGYDNVGFHLSTREVTLDFNGTFEDNDILKVEQIVNNAIYENFETHIFVPTKEELKNIEYRSKKEIEGDVRIVEYPGYDICACCAPHVKRTGEIGMIKIVAYEHFKGGTRVWIKCGNRALSYFNALLSNSKQISQITSAKIEEIAPAVDKMNDTVKDLRFNNIRLGRIILNQLADQALASENPIIFTDSCDNDSARETVNIMASKSNGFCSIFIGDDSKGYRFLIGSEHIDCRTVLSKLKEQLAVKGGGSDSLIQGSLSATSEQIQKIFEEMR